MFIKLFQYLIIPILIALLWGWFMRQRAQTRADDPWRLMFELFLFGGIALLLAFKGPPGLAVVAVIAFILNRVLVALWWARR